MNKFRVISDLHIDINEKYPITINDDIFTVICGDTSGYTRKTIHWIKKNIKSGVGVSGNHLPYNEEKKPIQTFRQRLAKAFTINNDFTYLDCETNTFYKEVDGILFIGTCMYTDMSIKHEIWNPNGDKRLNMACSEYNMNDYKYGIKNIEYVTNTIGELEPKVTHISANDYFEWFKNAYNKIEDVLNKNEACATPKPVVLITHHPLIADFLTKSYYVDDATALWRQRDFNWASYASDMKKWLKRHTSIKCYCCGHIHYVYKDYKNFYIEREDKSKILVVNNARGYVVRGHDINFNKNTFVNTTTWEVETTPLTAEEIEEQKKNTEKMFKNLAWMAF